MADRHAIQGDFDRIASLPPSGFDHNAYYHDWILRSLPKSMSDALDVGCGTGQFTRLLAARADRVIGLDFARNMIAAARRDSVAFNNIEFSQADVVEWDWPIERFDAIVSIAAMHHLPMEEMFRKMATALRPGGILAILDIRTTPTIAERLMIGGTAFAWSMALHLFHTRRLRPAPEVRRAWAEHGSADRYLSVTEVRRVSGQILPGAAVRRHLLWRYSLIWRKPYSSTQRSGV